MPSEREGGDPRNNAEDAYLTFVEMDKEEWRDVCFSLLRGGVLTPAEQEGFERATLERARRMADMGTTEETMEL